RRGCVMSRTVPNHPALLLLSFSPEGHCYELVGLEVAVGDDVGDEEADAEDDGLEVGDELSVGELECDGDAFTGGLTGFFLWLVTETDAWPCGVYVGVGDPEAPVLAAPGAEEVYSWTEVRLGSPVVLPNRLPLRKKLTPAASAQTTTVTPAAS